MGQARSFTVVEPGARLDKFVSESCPELSRATAQKLIEGGFVTVNGRPAKPSLKLNSGVLVEVTIPPAPLSPLSEEIIPLKIVYEDGDVLVIDKPAGLTVHPSPGQTAHTLVNALLSRLPQAEFGDSLRPGIVHRLDKDTSGLMLVAKNKASQAELISQFKARTIKKAYLTLVRGRVTPEQGIIEASIGRDPRNRKKMAVVNEGRPARSRYKVVKYFDGYTLLEVEPETGRTHQIRVHFAAIGFPVAGDATYGYKTKILSRQFLHACKLGFKLPSTGDYIEFKSELPEDLRGALDLLERG